MNTADNLAVFESRRAFLISLAYRLLGSLAEAEDAVQDTFLKWRETAGEEIDNPAAWLTAVCTRRCIDLLKSARSRRVEYVGTWLPEPVHMETNENPESVLELSSSLTTAFLLLLERLTPKERAAYLLHDIFDRSYAEIAGVLDMEAMACRKLVSRARTHLGQARARHQAPRARQAELLEAFREAVVSGVTGELEALLSEDIELCSDGGGKVAAIRRPLRGKRRVLGAIEVAFHKWWHGCEWRPAEINGGRGVMILRGDSLVAVVTFCYDAYDRLSDIYIMRNPDKLEAFRRRRAAMVR